jgi:hypothetical protein
VSVLDPFRFVLISIAGWMNQQQQQAIDYLREEKWGAARAARRSPTSFHGRPASPARGASQRARPTRAAADPNDHHPWDSAGLALKADRSDGSASRGPGRPRMEDDIESLVVQMAVENRT